MIYVLEDQGGREYMEDRHVIEQKFFLSYDLYAVFDGHGNDSVAKYLQLYFKDILRNELFHEQNIPKAMYDAFKKMSDLIPRDLGFTAGSTALVILENSDESYIANIGDCRGLININDKSLQITVDHKPNLPSELERIKAAGGFVINDPMGTPRVNGNLSLSRAFGDFYLSPSVIAVPEIYHYKLHTENNYTFIASDGVFDVVENDEIVTIINQEKLIPNKDIKLAIRDACRKILLLARSRNSQDNITIIVRTRRSEDTTNP
jgi:serine/threonine protein phosphatase PrpC